MLDRQQDDAHRQAHEASQDAQSTEIQHRVINQSEAAVAPNGQPIRAVYLHACARAAATDTGGGTVALSGAVPNSTAS